MPPGRIFTRKDIETAKAARRTRKLAALQSNVRFDWPDDARWVDLATERGVRLPLRLALCTPASIARFLHRLGRDGAWFKKWSGYNPAGWIAMNPRWSLRAVVGLILEEL